MKSKPLLTTILPALLLTSLIADIQYATTTKVVDGDTVYFKSNSKELKCRIAYIDTPESSKNNKAKKDVDKCNGIVIDSMVQSGKLSKEYTSEYFKIGSKHKIDVIGTDHYGREVCEIDNFNIEIVKDGYAIPFAEYTPSSKQREFNVAEKEAKQNNRGLWRSHKQILECLKK